jgi:hypothetical protein
MLRTWRLDEERRIGRVFVCQSVLVVAWFSVGVRGGTSVGSVTMVCVAV